MKKKMVALLAGAMMMMATSAMALPLISGTIDIVGASALTTTAPDPLSFANANAIDFTMNAGSVISTTGDFTAVPLFSLAALQDFTFSPALTPAVISPLWAVSISPTTAFSFDLSSIIVTRSAKSLELSGTGTLYGFGFDPTPGVWDLTTQSSNGDATLALSFSENTAAVPEPGTMMLVGLGMLGMAVYGKRRQNKEA